MLDAAYCAESAAEVIAQKNRRIDGHQSRAR